MRASIYWIGGSFLLAVAGGVAAQPAVHSVDKQGGIVKWVDDKGVTHYGDALPPEQASRSVTVLNKSGRVLRKTEASKPPTQQAQDPGLQKQLADQQRRDVMLLASYTTEQEIDLARERSTQTEEAAIKALEQQAVGVRERLAMHQKSADSYTARKQPIPDDLKQDISSVRAESGKIQAQIAQKRKNIEETRVRYEQDKRRFHELKTTNVETAATRP
ncbi:MAG TPA: DUF4124 domain-containing protein [Anaerolineae bacterium]|nr:DUF4124 domain-containing protein [Anaerolineae bacterium]